MPSAMLVQVLAGAILLFLLFSLFRFAMGLRWAKVSRETARTRVEEEGGRVVAELPLASGEVVLLTEDERGFSWGAGSRVDTSALVGVRMRLNGGVLAEHVREGARLPPPQPPEEYEGRERWDVAVFAADGSTTSIPCGSLREGVSREVAARVFAAVKRCVPGG